MRLIVMLILIALTMPASTAQAQDLKNTRVWTELAEIDKSRPLRSAKYFKSKAVLTDRVLDKTNRVVGEVRDITLDRNGAISGLMIDFNRLRLGTGPLFIGYIDAGMRTATNGFKMSYTDDEIRARLPQFLSNLETASGRGQDTYSLRALIGSAFYNEKGQKLGNIKDVLLDKQAQRAKFIYVTLTHKSVRGEKLVIPFRELRLKSAKLTLRDKFAVPMIAFAQEK